MEHIAILKKSWNFLPKILSGEKTIESRWYVFRRKPWNTIKSGEAVYFKDSGEPVTVQAQIEKVLQFCDLNPNKVKELLEKHGKQIGIPKESFSDFINQFKNKKYCLLIYLKNPKQIKPFQINKKGFGNMAAWITVPKVDKIKK